MTRRNQTDAGAPAAMMPYGRMRLILSLMLVVLVVILGAIVWMVSRLLTPEAPLDTVKPAEGITWVRSIYGWGAAADQQFQSPAYVAVAPDGTIWVTDSAAGKVLSFSPDGEFKGELKAGEGEQDMLQSPSGIAVDEDGSVYVASARTGLIVKWLDDGDGTPDGVFDAVQPPIQVAARGGRLLVSAPDGLHLLDANTGEKIASWASRGPGADQVDLPQGLHIGEDDTLYVCDSLNRQIKAYSADGAKVKWANPPVSPRVTAAPVSEEALAESHPSTSSAEASGTADLASTLQIPVGLTMDDAGRLIFADAFSYAIYIADAKTGEILEKYGDIGEQEGAFNLPTGVAYDAGRDWIVVTDPGNKRVQILRLQGTGGGAIEAVRRVQIPWGLVAIPVVLFVAAGVVAVVRRRRLAGVAD